MHTSWLLLLLSVAVEPAAAQTPTPPQPARPAAPKPPSREQPGVTPRAPRAPLLADQMRFELAVPSRQYHNLLHEFQFEFPHEPLLPLSPLSPLSPLPPLELQWPHEPLLPHLPALEFQLPHEPLFLSMTSHVELFPSWTDQAHAQGNLSRMRPEQGSPEDSLFRAAREALNRGEYSRASAMFQSLGQRFPRSRVAPSAMYWQAFALYRSGASDELRAALEALKAQQERYPEAAADPDAATLRTRLYAALAARGDAQAASALRAATAQGPTCDREEMEVRVEALNALAQLNAPEARPTLKRVLARRDECSATLRRRAVYILGRSGTEEATADLIDAAKNDPDPGVRSDAIMLIARAPGAATVRTLEQLFNESTDERTKQAALSALRAKGGPEAKRALRAIIEKGDLPERTRAEAIQQLGRGSIEVRAVNTGQRITVAGQQGGARELEPYTAGDEEDATFLRGLYPKTDARAIKSAIIASVARIGGTTNEQWLLAIAKNRSEDISLRREALSRLKTSALSIDELSKLFDALSERELRYAVVSQLANRDDPAATDKLIEIVRSGTDPQVRRQALHALTQKKDPRTTKLLLELVEKP